MHEISDINRSHVTMARDGDVPAIFNPKRVRTPSVVVTGDSPNEVYGSFTEVLSTSNPQISHQDSISSSQQDSNEVITLNVDVREPNTTAICFTSRPCSVSGASDNNMGFGRTTGTSHNLIECETSIIKQTENSSSHKGTYYRRFRSCKESCCCKLAKKMYFGVCVTILVTASWIGATHCIKFLYLSCNTYAIVSDEDISTSSRGVELELVTDTDKEVSDILAISDNIADVEDATKIFQIPKPALQTTVFSAPFFAAWFFTNFSFLYFPVYVLGRVSLRKCDKPSEILGDVLRGFRDRGFTVGRFFNRCFSFCILWLCTTYLYTRSLQVLFATDAMALFATNVTCVYLLSWVILHEQFVGVRIVAVILCDTGIALLAYMDGITESPTLSGVVLATLAAAGYAVFRVMFRKVMGDPPVGQIAFTFTALGFLNALLAWPICLALYLTGTESMPSDRLPWIILLIASILLMIFHILTQFSSAVTYNMFVTLGLITAVPVSGALDVILYGATFAGMKLAGVILIAVGFFLVMFPENWPDYITRLLRKSGRAILRYQCCCELEEIHYLHSMGSRSSPQIISRSTSANHRLSDGVHQIPSSLTLWPCEMTDLSPTGYYSSQQQQHHQHQIFGQQTTFSSNIVLSPVAGGGGRLLSYFGSDYELERKKSETSFFNLGFRRKSTVVYYGSTD